MTEHEFATPDEAEEAFYDAFEKRDLKGMMSVWDDEDSITCIHPMTAPLYGRQQISSSWKNIFRHSPELQIETSAQKRTLSHNLAIHILYEHIMVEGNDDPNPPIIATNIYRLTKKGWKLIMHHASPSSDLPDEDDDDEEEEERVLH